jgi:hypothetical protein
MLLCPFGIALALCSMSYPCIHSSKSSFRTSSHIVPCISRSFHVAFRIFSGSLCESTLGDTASGTYRDTCCNREMVSRGDLGRKLAKARPSSAKLRGENVARRCRCGNVLECESSIVAHNLGLVQSQR